MSIASEFDSTIENIKSDYEGLENIGADLTNIDKNIYNIRTCLDNIYSSLPKTTGEGSNLSLTTLKGRINVDDILGDTQQDTTTGKNKLNSIMNLTQRGVTIINDNKTLVFNGTAESSGNINNFSNTFTLSSGTYTLCLSYVRGSLTTSGSNYVRLRNSSDDSVINGITITSSNYNSTTLNVTMTLSEDTTMYLSFYVANASAFSNLTYNIQVVNGSTADYNYEQYTGGQASPNPTYPQNIEVVTGTQEVVVENKNSANVNATQIGKAWNNASNSARAILVLPIEHNTQYTISYGSLGSLEGIYYGYRTEEETAGTGVTQMSTTPLTITTNDTNNYIIFQFNKTSISLADIQAINLQVELGSIATSYIEHQEQTKTLHLGDIELAKIGTYVDRIYKNNDKWYIEKKIGKAVLNGSETITPSSTSVSNHFRYLINIDNMKQPSSATEMPNILSNRYIAQVMGTSGSWGAHQGISINNSSSQLVINDDTYYASDTSAYKTWLSSNNVEVLFAYATPTYTEITNETLLNELNELEKMYSYNGQTNISVSGNLPMILDVSALKGE